MLASPHALAHSRVGTESFSADADVRAARDNVGTGGLHLRMNMLSAPRQTGYEA
jgi:hypothetical protein